VSLYRSWNVSRSEIQQVNVKCEAGNSRGGPHAEDLAAIHLRDGDRFRTV
jgi:hypothetical protein